MCRTVMRILFSKGPVEYCFQKSIEINRNMSTGLNLSKQTAKLLYLHSISWVLIFFFFL